MQCDQVAERLPAAAEGLEALDPAARRHVERCLRCQADAVQYRRVLRAMRALRTEVLVPAPGLLPELLASLGEAGEQQAVRAMFRGRACRVPGWPGGGHGGRRGRGGGPDHPQPAQQGLPRRLRSPRPGPNPRGGKSGPLALSCLPTSGGQ